MLSVQKYVLPTLRLPHAHYLVLGYIILVTISVESSIQFESAIKDKKNRNSITGMVDGLITVNLMYTGVTKSMTSSNRWDGLMTVN